MSRADGLGDGRPGALGDRAAERVNPRACLDFGMARCPAPYGGEDLSPGTALEPVCYHVATVTGTGQVG